ncbi:MFS transporter [Streptomyces sp. NPDC003036]|uniref:MFS transporter n=1 Tax=Streptomyces sp. NPDC003036 TaxID=3154442 RepID=UPI0033B589C4
MISTRTAVAAAFVLNGMVYGSWVGRVPALAHQVGADEGALGLALLGQVAGLLAGATFAGWACAALGTRRVTLTALPAMCLALVVLSLPGGYALLGAAFFVIGFTVGTLDVAMNICAVFVTAQVGRPLMSFFHAVFSTGAVAGSAGAALAAWADWGTRPHFLLVAAVALVLVAVFGRHLPTVGAEQKAAGRAGKGGDAAAPRPVRQVMLWLIAFTLFCAAIGEGAMANWSVLFLDTERGMSASAAAAGYTVFSVATVVVRFLGVRLEERLGPYLLLGLCGATAAGGLLIAVALPWAAAGYAGLALAGLGFALVFPVAIGQAGKHGQSLGTSGEREVGFVSSVAYVGLVTGPPAIGALAHATSLSVALGCVGGVVALVVVFSRLAARRDARTSAPPGRVPPGSGGGHPEPTVPQGTTP